MSDNSPTFSIVTTCKGRLEDLKRTLPLFAAQPDTEVIVTDFDCPDGAKAYVEANFPNVKVVKVENRPDFNLPEARNLAAAQAAGKVLVFLDADVLIAEDFISKIDLPLNKAAFGLFPQTHGNSLRGSSLIRREHFNALGGFDELLSGYEGEDLDMYMRLRVMGARAHELPAECVVNVFEQSQEERERFRRPGLKRQFLRGQLYQLTKEMVMRSQGILVLQSEKRASIMREVDKQLPGLARGEREFELNINFPDKYKRGLLSQFEFSTGITVRAKRKPQN